MFTFGQQNELTEQENTFALCADLLSVAAELGIETPFAIGLSADMELEQLKSVQQLIADTIEATYQENKERLRRMRRCPAGYIWDREGDGWRCQGGSHYCTAQEIKQYIDEE